MADDERPDAPSRWYARRAVWAWAGTAAAAALLAWALFAPPSRVSPRPGENPADSRQDAARPFDAAVDLLRRDPDIVACQAAVRQLNAELLQPESAAAVTPAAPPPRDEWKLREAEVSEVDRPEFTNLDAYHLESAFALREAAGAVPPGLSVAARAAAAAAWAHRQLWVVDRPVPPVPSLFALRRGFGSELERLYAAADLAVQLDLDACLIGHLDGDRPAKPWALGVLDGADILLLDPRGGGPVLSDDGKTPATLARLRADPAPFARFLKAVVVSAEQAKRADAYLFGPLSGLSPRMARLQERLRAKDLRVTVAADAAGQRERLGKAGGGAAVRVWNPPAADGGPWRMLPEFLPTSEGGFDKADERNQRLRQYRTDLVPWSALPEPISQLVTALPDRAGPVVLLRGVFETPFLQFRLGGQPFLGESVTGQSPRDAVVRGHFSDITASLNQRRTPRELRAEVARNPNLDAEVRDWVERLKLAFAQLARAEGAARSPVAPPDAAETLGKARAAYGSLIQTESGKAGLAVRSVTAELLAADAAYELGLCKHELAEQAALRPGGSRDEARKSAQRAADTWRPYLNEFADRPHVPADRGKHARSLARRAEELAR